MKNASVVLILILSIGIPSLRSEEVKVLLNPKPEEARGALAVLFPPTQQVVRGQRTFDYRLINRTSQDIFVVVDGPDVMWLQLQGPSWGMGSGGSFRGLSNKELLRLLYAPTLDSDGKPVSGWEQARAETECKVSVSPGSLGEDLTGLVGGKGELSLRLVFCVGGAQDRQTRILAVPLQIELAKGKGAEQGASTQEANPAEIWGPKPWGPKPIGLVSGEPERRAKVQALVKQLADESPEKRQAALVELQDTVVRKRDIPELTEEIARNANPEVTKSLQKLITFIEGRWRLPDKGWAADIYECAESYGKEFDNLGYVGIVGGFDGYRYDQHTDGLDLFDVPSGAENWTRVINLILTLEPKALILPESWTDITFLGSLASLEELTLERTLVTDLTPLKEMTSLRGLWLQGTKVTDLTPLKGMPNLEYLNLRDTVVTDLTPLKGKPNLEELHLQNTGVTDLTPLKGLPNLRELHLQNTGVTDLTPLEGMPGLTILRKEKE